MTIRRKKNPDAPLPTPHGWVREVMCIPVFKSVDRRGNKKIRAEERGGGQVRMVGAVPMAWRELLD